MPFGRRSRTRRGSQAEALPAVRVPSLEELLDFCARDPVERVFLEDVARRGLGQFLALDGETGIDAVCHLGVNVVPAGSGCAAFADAVAESGPRMLIGYERAVEELWEQLRGRLGRPRYERSGQPVFMLREPPPPGESGLRRAHPADLELLLPAAAAAHEEELGIDPLERDEQAFRWRTRGQIELGRSWLWEEGGRILFKAEASAWTPAAVQLQQVWTDPELRGRGHARRALRDLCRELLGRTACVCLFVRPENAPAIRLYEAVGMERVATMRSILL
jgi:ribosomal protein S18 acetylase RimI-like enzyme